jgi:hypothetical protein
MLLPLAIFTQLAAQGAPGLSSETLAAVVARTDPSNQPGARCAAAALIPPPNITG